MMRKIPPSQRNNIIIVSALVSAMLVLYMFRPSQHSTELVTQNGKRTLHSQQSDDEIVQTKEHGKSKSAPSYTSEPKVDVCNFNENWYLNIPSDWPKRYTYNPLDDTYYIAHPVFHTLPLNVPYQFNPKYITEETGLRVPFAYDCTPWSSQKYHLAVPSRWVRCEHSTAQKNAAFRSMMPEIPIIDEEYIEQIAVFTSVLNAEENTEYSLVEMGARWGTWGARAAAFAKKARPDLSVDLLFYEPDENSVEGLNTVMKVNNIENYQVVAGPVTAEHFNKWASSKTMINLVDIDIQKHEKELVPLIMDSLLKTKRVIVGTHNAGIHGIIKTYFKESDWTLIRETPFSRSTACVTNNLRTSRNHFPGKWNEIIEEGCYEEKEDIGKVCQYDGELIYDNKRFSSECIYKIQS